MVGEGCEVGGAGVIWSSSSRMMGWIGMELVEVGV